ncbi:MAG: hypothetical protein ABSB78_05900 [Bacteroidota bacterium]
MNQNFNPLNPPYWQYFLAMEDDLSRASRFVEFVTENLGVYSLEFARLLLSSSSEIDVIAKEFCKLLSSNSKCDDINDYQTIILKHYPMFATFEVNIPRFSLNAKPWDEWNRGSNLTWWKAYNNVKHERSKYYNEATLGNSIDSVAALFTLLLYYYRQLQHHIDKSGRIEIFLNPPPKLFSSLKYLYSDKSIRISAFDLPDKYLYTGTP